MKISIIVPVYNRAEEMREFLASFSRQTARNFEILVIDDGSTDSLLEVIREYENKLDLKYFHQNNQGPGRARNLGMEKAGGDYFLFIDSDCTVPENYVETLSGHLAGNDLDAFGGPDSCREDFPDFLKAVNYSMTSFIGTGGTRGSTGKMVTKYYPRGFNMGIKREIYEKLGGMNELRHGQDIEYSHRIIAAGYRIKYLPDVVVFHKRRTNLRKFFKQIFNWGVGRVNLSRIDSRMLKPVHLLPLIVLFLFMVTLILGIFNSTFRVIFLSELVLVLIILVSVMLHASRQYHSIKVGLLADVTLITQVLGYALGLMFGTVMSIFSGNKFISGFTKNYYK